MSGDAGKLGASVPTSKGEEIFLKRQKNLETTAAEVIKGKFLTLARLTLYYSVHNV